MRRRQCPRRPRAAAAGRGRGYMRHLRHSWLINSLFSAFMVYCSTLAFCNCRGRRGSEPEVQRPVVAEIRRRSGCRAQANMVAFAVSAAVAWRCAPCRRARSAPRRRARRRVCCGAARYRSSIRGCRPLSPRRKRRATARAREARSALRARRRLYTRRARFFWAACACLTMPS